MSKDVDLAINVLAKDNATAVLGKVGKGAGKTGKDFEKFGRNAKLAFAAAGAAAGLFAKQSISAASDLSESVSKVNAVFGDQAAAINKWGDAAATSMGLSKQAALEAASTFGNLFTAMSMSKKSAAPMSQALVKLAGDIASFNNVSIEDALAALRSGMTGEIAPLRRFGINLTDASLKQEAFRLGLVKTTKEALQPAAKAQASYSLIMKQSTTTQGDFARTSDGLANKQRIMAAQITDLKAKLGEGLLPITLKVVSALTAMAKWVERNRGTVVPLTAAVAALAVSIWAVNSATKAVKAAQAAWSTILPLLTKRTAALAAANKANNRAMLLGRGAVLGFAAAAVYAAFKIGKAWEKAMNAVMDARRAMDDRGNVAENLAGAARYAQRKGLTKDPRWQSGGYGAEMAKAMRAGDFNATWDVVNNFKKGKSADQRRASFEVGADIGDGLALGIESKKDKVSSALDGYRDRISAGMTKIEAVLEASKAKLASFVDYRKSVVEQAKGHTALASLVGGDEKITAAGMRSSLKGRATKVAEFAANIRKMKRQGYGPAIISQVLAAGIDQGSEMAHVLVQANDAQSFNSLADMASESARNLGFSAGWAVNGSGEKDARGVVASQTQQVRDINYEIKINGALDPLSVARQVEALLAKLKRERGTALAFA